MTAATMADVIGTPEKRDWFVRFLMWVVAICDKGLAFVRAWKSVAKENAHLQDEIKKGHIKDPAEIALIQAKSAQDISAMAEEVEVLFNDVEDARESGEAHHVAAFDDNFSKIQSEFGALVKRKRIDFKEAFYIVEFVGPHNNMNPAHIREHVEHANKSLRRKVLRHRAEKLRIEAYTYRIGVHYLKLVEMAEPIAFRDRDELQAALDNKVLSLRKGLINREDREPEHVLAYIQNNRNTVDQATLLKNLKPLRIVVGMNAVKIDGLDLADNLLHVEGLPRDVWVPIRLDDIIWATKTTNVVAGLQPKLGKTYLLNIEHAIAGKDQKGQPLTDSQIRQFDLPKDKGGFGLSRVEVNILSNAKNHLRVR